MHCKANLIYSSLVPLLIPAKIPFFIFPFIDNNYVIKLIFGRQYLKLLSNFKLILTFTKNFFVFVLSLSRVEDCGAIEACFECATSCDGGGSFPVGAMASALPVVKALTVLPVLPMVTAPGTLHLAQWC